MMFDRCSLCPRLCRSACPVSTVREAATPSTLAAVLRAWTLGQVDDTVAAQAATLCTDCGGCEDHCHLSVPLPAALHEARRSLVAAPDFRPLEPLAGRGRMIALATTERPFAAALAQTLGQEVIAWRTYDQLGVLSVDHADFPAHLRAIAALCKGRKVIVSDGGCAVVLQMAGVQFEWLTSLVPVTSCGVGSCQLDGDKPLQCCGGAGPLVRHHKGTASDVGALFVERGGLTETDDSRCNRHLGLGRDAVDRLIEAGG